MTNLLNLLQVTPGTSIQIASNADWLDTFYVPVPGLTVGNYTTLAGFFRWFAQGVAVPLAPGTLWKPSYTAISRLSL